MATLIEGWEAMIPTEDWITKSNADQLYVDPAGDPIKQTIEILTARSKYYAFYRAYHCGRHRLLFQSEKFQNLFGRLFRGFADNLLPVVVDTFADRLQVAGFDVLEGLDDVAAKTTKSEIQKIWVRERFDQVAAEIHNEALICGDAYAIVWPEKNEADVSVYPQRAEECLVAHDPDAPDDVLWASKMWRSGNRYRLNIYYPEKIEKYAGPPSTSGNLNGPSYPTNAQTFKPLDGEDSIPNPFGVVPVFHFANNARMGCFGESELRPLIALQDALNKAVVDMLVAFEFMAVPQRFASGIEVKYGEDGKPIAPFQPGVDRVWIAEHPEARFGQFDPAPLTGFVEIQESFRREIARISGIPMYYLLQTGQFPSGDALRMAEARLISRCEAKQGAFGNTWEDLMEFYLRLGKKDTVPEGVVLSAAWKYPAPVDPSTTIETLIQKQQLGVDQKTLLLEAGYGEKEVDEMVEAKEAQAANLAETMQTRFDAGQLD